MQGKQAKFKALDSIKGFLEGRMSEKLKPKPPEEEPAGAPEVGGEPGEQEPVGEKPSAGEEMKEDAGEMDMSKLSPEEQDELKRLYNKMCG